MVLNQPLGFGFLSHSGPMVFVDFRGGGTFKIGVSKMVWLACIYCV